MPLDATFSPPAPRRALVSLTPLIDIVFILLVFFMLASSFEDRAALPIHPAAPSASGGPAPPTTQLLVRATGVIFGGRAATIDEAARLAAAQETARPAHVTLVEAARGAPLQRVVSTLDALRAAGARNVAVAAR